MVMLQKLVGGPVPGEDFTLPRFEVASGADFIAVQLIMDFAREGPFSCMSPILNFDVSRLGISNRANRATINLVQVLYVKLPILTPEQQRQMAMEQQKLIQ